MTKDDEITLEEAERREAVWDRKMQVLGLGDPEPMITLPREKMDELLAQAAREGRDFFRDVFPEFLAKEYPLES